MESFKVTHLTSEMQRWFGFCLLLLCSVKNFGQIIPKKTSIPDTVKAIDKIDGIDVLKKIFHIRKVTKDDSRLYRPGKLYTTILPGVGYSIITGFGAVETTDLNFYTSSSSSANLSSVQIGIEYTQKNQFLPYIISNIWSPGNKYDFKGDFRYYKYSVYTYGLGGNSPTADPDFFYYSYLRIYQLALRRIAPDMLAGFGYNLDYHWDIGDAMAIPVADNDYYKYGSGNTTVSSGLSFNFLYDTRRNSQSPVAGGHYVEVIYRQNYQFMGSDQNWQSLFVDLRKYIALPRDSRNILAFWNFEWLTLKGKPPYFDLPSTNWDTYDNSGRPYIQGRYRGDNMLYFEAEYRISLTRNDLFGMSLFADFQSVSNWPNNSFETIIPGVGASFRVKANKHSKTSVNISYGIGTEGQRGFATTLGEYF